jgi:hypothetical protein
MPVMYALNARVAKKKNKPLKKIVFDEEDSGEDEPEVDVGLSQQIELLNPFI